jgi:hypothetical protein
MSGGSDIDMNTSAPQVKEVEPMEDIQDSPREKEVRINTAELDDKLRELINNMHPELYPETIRFATARPQINCATKSLKHVHKRRAIMVGNNDPCAGQHLRKFLQQVLARNNVHPQAITGSYSGRKLDVILYEPPENKCVKVFFHLDSQAPNIELLAYKVNKNTGAKTACQSRLLAEDRP